MFSFGIRNAFSTSVLARRYLYRCMATNTEVKNIGVIGVGQIGLAVSLGLAKSGHKVTVADPDTKNKNVLLDHGVNWVTTVAEAAEDKDVVFTAVPAPPQIRNVMEEQEVLNIMRKGSCWIDHTTTDSEETKRLSEKASANGLNKLEAPLTGGLALLQAGLMTSLVGGDKEVLKKYEPLIRCYTGTVLHMGPVGSGSIVKVISNMLAGAHLVIAAEATMLAKRQGIDLRSFFDGIRVSAGNSYVFETEVPLIFNSTFNPGFTVALHNKDLRLGRKIALNGKVPLEVMGLVEQIYFKALCKYGGEEGSSIPAKLIEDDLNESMHVDGFENWTYKIEKVSGGGLGVVHKNIKE